MKRIEKIDTIQVLNEIRWIFDHDTYKQYQKSIQNESMIF